MGVCRHELGGSTPQPPDNSNPVWPQRCCEAVRSAILATAWLLVSLYLNICGQQTGPGKFFHVVLSRSWKSRVFFVSERVGTPGLSTVHLKSVRLWTGSKVPWSIRVPRARAVNDVMCICNCAQPLWSLGWRAPVSSVHCLRLETAHACDKRTHWILYSTKHLFLFGS